MLKYRELVQRGKDFSSYTDFCSDFYLPPLFGTNSSLARVVFPSCWCQTYFNASLRSNYSLDIGLDSVIQ